MKVLFVFREKENIQNYLVRQQAESLRCEGVNVECLPFFRGGIRGYYNLYKQIRQRTRSGDISLVHAHYGLTCLVSGLASRKPVVASLMGSDVQGSRIMLVLLRICHSLLWKHTIVKSERMKSVFNRSYIHVIPNGVSFEIFRPVDKKVAKEKCGLPQGKHILFITVNPDDPVKNLALARKAIDLLPEGAAEFHVISMIAIQQLVYYYNAADVVLLTSRTEGSPNVIKEAMACNCPIVSTDVGDVSEVISDTEGCYLASHDEVDIADKLLEALHHQGRTNGRGQINYLNSKIVSERINELYKSIG